MQIWWNWRPRKGLRETGGRSNWRAKEIHKSGNGEGVFFIWRGTVSSWGTGPECRTVQEGCSSHSGCSKVHATTSSMMRKRATSQISLDQFLKRAHTTESSKEPGAVPSISGISEIEDCPPSPTTDDPSALSFPTSSPHPSHSSCLFSQFQLLYVSCYTILLYFSKYCKVKMFASVFLFMYCVKNKNIINLLVCLCLVVRLCPTLWGSLCCSQPGLIVYRDFQARILESPRDGARESSSRIFLAQGWNTQLMW